MIIGDCARPPISPPMPVDRPPAAAVVPILRASCASAERLTLARIRRSRRTVMDNLSVCQRFAINRRSEEHTSELQSLMRISYAVFCLKKKKEIEKRHNQRTHMSDKCK